MSGQEASNGQNGAGHEGTVTKSGHRVVPLEKDEEHRIGRHFRIGHDGLVRVMPGGWLYPGAFKHTADKIYDFQWREDDVLLAGFLKTGTTWMQEVVWTMRNNPDLDHPEAHTAILDRVPIIDTDMFINPKSFRGCGPEHPLFAHLLEFKKKCPEGVATEGVYIQTAGAVASPRTLKTHYPFSLLPPNTLTRTKVVYTARNPRDVIVSLHHMYRLFKHTNFSGDLKQFVEYFLNDEVLQGPYWRHVREAWDLRHNINLHFVFYEDLKADTMKELRKLDAFLGTNLTDEQLMNVQRHTSFGQMQQRNNFTNTTRADNPRINAEVQEGDGGFFRKGVVGGWKEKLSEEMTADIDQWAKETLNDIPFTYSC